MYWISCKAALPQEDIYVLVTDEHKKYVGISSYSIESGWRDGPAEYYVDAFQSNGKIFDAIHIDDIVFWMPLPNEKTPESILGPRGNNHAV